MDLFAAILIGIAIGIWLAVTALFFFVRDGWIPPYAGGADRGAPSHGAIHPARRASNPDTIDSAAPDPVGTAVRGRTPARDQARAERMQTAGAAPPNAAGTGARRHSVTYAEVDRASKGDPVVARHLRYLMMRYARDEDAIMEIIRDAEEVNPDAEVGDWVVAAAEYAETTAETDS